MQFGRLGEWLRPTRFGLVVAVAIFALLSIPGLVGRSIGPASATPPLFPTEVASYSWYTSKLRPGQMEAASLLYQNGVGVETVDYPMAVLLATDGSTYRRFAPAEARSVPDDQGDPAASVLAPDGTFVVVGSSGVKGDIEVVTLRNGHRRTLPIGAGRAALPVAIGADSRTVLLAVSDSEVDRYAQGQSLGLASVDLVTGSVRDYPRIKDVEGAALSPDGKRIATVTGDTLEVVDARSGNLISWLPVDLKRDPRCDADDDYEDEADAEDATAAPTAAGAESPDDEDSDTAYSCPWLSLDGDAWSPDGRRIALTLGKSLIVADLAGAEPSLRRLPLKTPEYSGGVLGWRDDTTVLVHASTDGDENTSKLLWVDSTTGAEQIFASYRPNFTVAAMGAVDAASDLIPKWQVEPRPINRGPLPMWAALLGAAAAGLLAMLLAAILAPWLPRSKVDRDSSDELI